jgi:transposase InsO family protein
MRYRCVDAQKAAGFPVAAACQAAGVTRSAYYAWATGTAQGPAQRQREEARLVGEIRRIHARSRGTYGSPRVTAELGRRGWSANHKRVERLMRRHDIVGYRPRRRRSLTRQDRAAPPAPDLLGRLFDPDQPDVAWCGDVTYVPADEGWLYLASVIDLASRHLLGYSMSSHHDAQLVCDALDAAVATRGRPRMPDTIFHTDRGGEYTSGACVEACERLGLRRSMGRTGSCLDNAVAESWSTGPTGAPAPRPARRSSAGSPGTTGPGCTPPVATCHPSSGNTSTPSSTRYHRPRPHSPGVHLPGGGPGKPADVGLFTVACGSYVDVRWLRLNSNGTPQVPGPTVDPFQLALSARDRLPLPTGGIGANPVRSLVGLPTWFWYQGYDGRPLSKTVSAFGVAVQVQAIPTSYRWDFGDGTRLTSSSLGRPYPARSPITHTYMTARAGVRVRCVFAFALRWRTGGGPWAPLPPLARTATATLEVAESQAVINR